MPIMSPSGNDGRQGNPPQQVATHAEIIEPRSGIPGLVIPCQEDLAIALVPDESLISSWQGDVTNGYDTPVTTANPAPGMKVKKFGRTTALTHGKIESAVTRTAVKYESEHFNATVWFRGAWVVRPVGIDPFGVGGNSGSLIVTEDGSATVGMLFAANVKGNYALIVPVERILAAFGGLELVGSHGV